MSEYRSKVVSPINVLDFLTKGRLRHLNVTITNPPDAEVRITVPKGVAWLILTGVIYHQGAVATNLFMHHSKYEEPEGEIFWQTMIEDDVEAGTYDLFGMISTCNTTTHLPLGWVGGWRPLILFEDEFIEMEGANGNYLGIDVLEIDHVRRT